MVDNMASIADIQMSVQAHKGTLDRILDQIDASVPDELDEMRRTYTSQLAPEWGDLSRTLDTPVTTVEVLRLQVVALTDFIDRFNEIVQEPRISGISQRLSRWSTTWTKRNITWQAYLQSAADNQLEEIEERVERLSQVNIINEAIEDLVRRWLTYQAERLRMTEKLASHVLAWLIRVEQNVAHATQLADDLQTLGMVDTLGEEQEITTVLRQTWVAHRLTQIAARSVEVENLNLDDFRAVCTAEWERIHSALPNLCAAIASCTEAEVPLVRAHIRSWESVKPLEIDSLLRVIADIRTITAWYTENMALLGSPSMEEWNLTRQVDALIAARPGLPAPESQSSLLAYRDSMVNYQGVAEKWLVDCHNHTADVVMEIERLRNSTWPPEVLQSLPQLNVDGVAPTSLGEIVHMSWQLRHAELAIEEFAERSLSAAERVLWQRLQELRRHGHHSVNLEELAQSNPCGEMVATLGKLVERNLIRVKVEL